MTAFISKDKLAKESPNELAITELEASRQQIRTSHQQVWASAEEGKVLSQCF